MNSEEFRRHGHEMIDWIADYLENSARYPVMAQVEPGDIRALLPESPPVQGQPMADIWADFQRDIMPGVTHWNHPRFFAYFPANNSGPSILGELLAAGLGVNAMLWQTCPAATELEQTVMQWLGGMIGLPAGFHGVIQDTASTASLTALVCAREKSTAFAVNKAGPDGLAGAGALRVYVSADAHSSILKGARIAGFGAENVVRVGIVEDPTRGRMMDTEDLDLKIRADLKNGLVPCCVVATVGTTGSTALDSLDAIGSVTQQHGVWLHVDAALAGSAAILPEMRWLLDGIEHADSFVFNPHKWLFTNFDCSAYFVRDPDHLERTMSVNPEYLKTGRDREVSNFMDWGIPLGRRFRALKLWFVLRHYGTAQLQDMIRAHLALAQEFALWVDEAPDWERLEPVPVNTVCFRWKPDGIRDPAALEAANADLLERINREGTIYLTHTKLDGVYTLRLAVGQRATRREHVVRAWEVLKEAAGQ
jgi:aromatic-L-amino-acid decarboxylase